ncbi:MAG: P1 family peptidase [Acidobacteriota bacterium]
MTDPGLTAVDGLLVGHSRRQERPTGCTVVLAPDGAVAGVEQRGGAPGTRELGLLDPANTVQEVHAVVLSGGSAFGLDAASGTVRYLEEKDIGFDVGVAKVPIVVGAILFDLRVGDASIRPTADCGYAAARTATANPVAQGNEGAGAGATVGKWLGTERAMKGGLGSASITTADGLTVAALVAVNAVGDVVDPYTGRVVAGVRDADGRLADARKLMREPPPGLPGTAPNEAAQNTTIGVVATNARLDKAQATKFAQMSDDGFARALVPSHTPGDGDTIFALSTGTWNGPPDLRRIGALGAEVVAEAILRAVEAAESLEGLPSATELGTTRRER